ncbi:MAG: M28 family peptidase [Myxococcales bacterium]|nr:M28 family peptidase [Myxococcales bacterium]
MPTARSSLALFSFLLLPGAAQAGDVPLPGKSHQVRAAKVAKVLAKADAPFVLPVAGSAQDPTAGGAELHFFDIGGDGGELIYTLDASGWKGLGKPPGSKGWKYKGKADTTAPDPKAACRSVVLKDRSLKATCKGVAVTLAPPYSGSAAVSLGFPAGASASRYCAVFGGDEKKNDARQLKRKKANAPVVCPLAPSAFGGYDAEDLITLADDALAGRQNLTPGSEAAQAFLIAELSPFAAGLDASQVGDDAYKQPFDDGTNILAIIPGGELADEYVIVGGHYDHIGSNCVSLEPGDDICNGATDNAAGSASVLAIGRQLAAAPVPPRRSVILAFWDAEEDGLLGSFHYVANPLVPLADTVAYVNFDIQGANLLPSVRNVSFAIGGETGGSTLDELVRGAIALETLDTQPVSLVFGQGRSDYVAFSQAEVPTVFFSDSTGGCYHTTGDEVGVVDFGKHQKQARIGYYVTSGLIDGDPRPAFVSDLPAATFDDLVSVRDIIDLGLADLGLFGPTDQATLQGFAAFLEGLVQEGESEFGTEDIGPFLAGTSSVISTLSSVPCDGFLAP